MEFSTQNTQLLRKLREGGYKIIGDYHYYLLTGVSNYAFKLEEDNDVLKLKSTLSLKDRIIFHLGLSLRNKDLSDQDRESIQAVIIILGEIVSEIVAAEKPEILDRTLESYSQKREGYNLSLFYERNDPKDSRILTHSNENNPLSEEYCRLNSARINSIIDNRELDPVTEQRYELLSSILFDTIESENERRQIMADAAKDAMDSSFVNDALEECLFVKVPFEEWLRLMGRDQLIQEKKSTKTRKSRPQKKGFTTPGEVLEGNTKVSIHAVRQMFNPKSKPNATPGQIAIDWGLKTGLPVNNEIDRYGLDLTTTQYKVMEGILRAFSETQYKGNLPSISVNETLQEQNIRVRSKSDVPTIFKNLVEVPRIQISQRDLFRLSGIDDNNKGEMMDGLEALSYLSVTQFCFYYTRMAVNETGIPEKDTKSGDFKKEEVQAIDKLFTVKRVSDDITKEFKYYEIMPSAIFLDQVDRYFLLVPRGWMEEVKGKVGLKRASSYTFRFLLYLRFQFEEKRRKIRYQKSKCRYEIKSPWQHIAKDLKMPESVYVRQRKRALMLLEDAYSTALQLGYLISHSREGDTDTLVLNEEKYPAPKED